MEEKSKFKIDLEFILNTLGITSFVNGVVLMYFDNRIALAFYVLSYILVGFDIFKKAIKHLFSKDMFDENFLMTLATLGALLIGEYMEGIAVLLFYKFGEFLQDKAVDKSKDRIKEAIDLKSTIVTLEDGDNIIKCEPEDLRVSDIIIIKNGEKIPVDGVIIEGSTLLDSSALTGESIPVQVHENDEVLSGSVNVGSVIKVKVKRTYEKSTVSEIIKMIENSSSKKSKTEKFVTKFAKIYTPIVVSLSVIISLILVFIFDLELTEALSRSLIFLVVSCPCALVVSIPLSYFVGIGACSKKGVLVKGTNYLEMLNRVDTVVFDKTGTLTKGKFKISNIKVLDESYTKEMIMEYIALCEIYSNHYLAKSVVDEYPFEINKDRVKKHEEISGQGIVALIDDDDVVVGNVKLIRNKNIDFNITDSDITTIYLAINNKIVGYITLSDVIKDDSEDLINSLKENGIKRVVMLTGDSKKIADNIANELKIDEVYSQLLPKDKVEVLIKIKERLESKAKVAYIGDGINDGPVLAEADVGISMGKGSDIAIETSDIVLMTDEPSKLIDSIKISRKTNKIAIQNIVFAIAVKVVFLLLSSFGYANMWEAVFADVGVSLIAILNCIRILR